MAVTIGTELVNNGNSGWTNADVMNALEKVFYDMGFNSGSQEDGVPIAILYPGFNLTASSNFARCIRYHYDATPVPDGDDAFKKCGGPAITWTNYSRRLYVTNNGTTSYQIAEEIRPTSSGFNNTIDLSGSMDPIVFPTGTKLNYTGQGSDVISGLSSGNTYYMRRVSNTSITLHNSVSDANNNVGIISISYTSMSDPKHFRKDSQTNPTITVSKGDQIRVHVNSNDGGDFRFCDFVKGAAYAADRDFHDNENIYSAIQRITGSGTYLDPYLWDTEYFRQTENEVLDPTQIDGTGYTGIHAYGYANTVNSSMKGNVVINFGLDNTSYNNRAYYKYTVPAVSGGRSELKLRIYRDEGGTDKGTISGILICSKATGWSDNEVFTIPGTAIGGSTPANDIKFGINTDETAVGAADGICSILTTSLGAGANMYQKHPDGSFGVLRIENDANKKFGTTYWGFTLHSNNYQLKIYSGSGWSYLNRLGKHFVYDSSYPGYFGCFNGDMGLDYGSGLQYMNRDSTSYFDVHNYATSAGPTNYALKIRYHKAQAPQDTNFAVISFIQTINNVDRAYFTFALHKGSTFGGNVWDLDDVFLGTYTDFRTQWQWQKSHDKFIQTRYMTPPGYSSGTGFGVNSEPVTSQSLAREASYGYLRNTGGDFVAVTQYNTNINGFNSPSEQDVHVYYRSSTYDFYQNNQDVFQLKAEQKASVGVNYYKPIKGLPISYNLAPCPYYIPDDFVMIMAEISPGATEFLPGDTVTISASEVYTVINADNLTNQTGQDGTEFNSAEGMLFCART